MKTARAHGLTVSASAIRHRVDSFILSLGSVSIVVVSSSPPVSVAPEDSGPSPFH